MASVFRVDKPIRYRGQAAAGTAPSDYFKRLIQLIPAEVLGLYITLKNLVPPDDNFVEIWPAVCVGLVFLVRAWGTREEGGGFKSAQWSSVAIAAVSFVIWIYAVGDSFFWLELPAPWYSGVAVGVWTFIVPYIYQGS